MDALATDTAFDFWDEARAVAEDGHDVIHLELGEPDFPSPPQGAEAVQRAIAAGWTKYVDGRGVPELRQALAEFESRAAGVPVAPEQVMPVPGSKLVLWYTLVACVRPGEEVLIPDPGYPSYAALTGAVGATPVRYPLLLEAGFRPDLDALKGRVSSRTRLVIINTPHNPTGACWSAQELAELAALARERELLVLSDEVYAGLVYEGRHLSLLEHLSPAEGAIVLESFSKRYAMTGWRLGWGVADPQLITRWHGLHVNTAGGPAAFLQIAAAEILRSATAAAGAMAAEFAARRDVFCEGLATLPGVRLAWPQGSFYAFARVDGCGDSVALSRRLLTEAHVATAPGLTFGPGGEGYLRFAFVAPQPRLREAIERITPLLSALAAA
jgi:aspartate/methionine/tyrosine aminotransferase